jgi:hypothetical protein
MKIKAIVIFLLVFYSLTSFSQLIIRSTIGTMGGSAKNETSLIQQTIGQPSATSFVGNPDGSAIRQGFHQPYLIETIKKDINVSVYPNPNDGNFAFEILEENSAPYQFQIIDQNGKLLNEGQARAKQKQEIRLGQVAQSIYFLKIFQGKQQSSFKINVIY